MGRRLIGIDLGTTHTVVAWLDPDADAHPRVFEVPRLTAPQQTGRKPTLASVLYAPTLGEVDDGSRWVVGDFAERRGREISGRAVYSAKSWLSYAAVDRNAAILPWGAEGDAPKISPVDASAEILRHVRGAWDALHPRYPMHEQSIVLTVPASFDPAARQLTLEAAQRAGLLVRLLEEPQAACYDYLERTGVSELEALLSDRERATILVCDVGGGTTDLTLLGVGHSPSGALSIERIAVGRHLLLGGDNMDLALAHLLEPRFTTEPGTRLPAHRFAQLVLATRLAKERLLGDNPPDESAVTLAAQGSALVGGTKSAMLSVRDVQALIVEGFFPKAPLLPLAARPRIGLVGFGLPYESEPAMTRHVSAFLHRHLGPDARVDALLLNGGVFLSERLVQALKHGVAPLSEPNLITLPQPHPELAVARGAAVYGLGLLGRGIRIGGGSAHGYYVAIDREQGEQRHAVCVVPRGSREAEKHVAASRILGLTVGAPVRFELYSSDAGLIHAPGHVVVLDDEYELVAPIMAHFAGEVSREVRVVLEGELTPVGTLELACVSTDPARPERFALAFELRGQESELGQRRSSDSPALVKQYSRLDQALDALVRVYGKGKAELAARDVKDLFRQLEKLLGAREQWTLSLNRQLFDSVGPKHKSRRRSIDHERLYWMLAGYLLRPGFGDPLDRTRTGLLVPLFVEGLAYPEEIRSWQQFFIAWRRIAPGLDQLEQSSLFEHLFVHLSPTVGRVKKKPAFRPLAEPEMLECATFLERLSNVQRTQLGEAILERTWTKRDPAYWTGLARVGARVPFYASVHHVVPPRVVEGWLDHLLREKWEQLPTAPHAAVQMARLTGDRARDVDDRVRSDLCRRLERLGTDPELWRPLRELVVLEEQERAERFGEQLPVGLRWVEESDSSSIATGRVT